MQMERFVRATRAGLRFCAAAPVCAPGTPSRQQEHAEPRPDLGPACEAVEQPLTHKPWLHGVAVLDAALATHELRTLVEGAELHGAQGRALHQTPGAGVALRGAKVTTRLDHDGRVDVVFKDRVLPFTTMRRLPRVAAIEKVKSIDVRLDAIITQTRTALPHEDIDGTVRARPSLTTDPTAE